ncbi:MAG: alpha amylase, partial [Acidobacteria bacterium]
MTPDILTRRERNFILWRAKPTPAPELIIGQLELGAPVAFVGEQRFALQQAAGFPDLWLIPAASCNLVDGQVYHYWFEVTDAHPRR